MNAKFEALTIDHDPRLLEESYRLRYQVYCVERRFFRAEDYPDGRELDDFDRQSVHVGVLDQCGTLAGTARIVSQGAVALPLFKYCSLFPHESTLIDPGNRVVEVSRLSVSRAYSRRQDDPFHQMPPPAEATDHHAAPTTRERRLGRDDVLLTLLKALYQATKRMRATHWIVATEKSLQRRGAEYGFPFRLAGPESEYSGRVAPYIMKIAELDQVILGGRLPAIHDFHIGLEHEFRPTVDEPSATAAPARADHHVVAADRTVV